MNIATSNQLTGIFCQHGPKNWQTSHTGPLVNKRLAVKDVFAVKNHINSAGNPSWFNSSNVAIKNADAINKLMEAGSCFISFTHTDELAYSLEGNNIHYGAAENPHFPGHACGGSSMGSAAAVAANLADIGLGTDTGGSIRIPASYCGLYGIRPSHNVIDTEGLIPLAPPFDTIGWFTQSADLLSNVGDVLLPEQEITPVNTLIVAEQLFDLVDVSLRSNLVAALDKIKPYFKEVKTLQLPNDQILSELADTFRILQGRAIAKTHRHWLENTTPKPEFSEAIQARFDMALGLSEAQQKEAQQVQQQWQKVIDANLNKNSCLFLPTTPTTAPKLGADTGPLRMQILTLSAMAGLSGSAQVHLPLTPTANGHPYGFSLMMSHANDKSLLACATHISNQFKQDTSL
ncbi:amidase [Pseudoalteromonas sp. MMG010]|uniref:amidase family protein n=1 Tax=Pseudoalteromonas sp. MMG010 TaxID=2822685 RepID=UPI001B3A4E7D|nr:amidase family protein [Pseudoalteromonas sp. MMG010]MBQ4832910.1 amidase [Pseudoalteromonas sp. MMG010]